MLPTHVKSLRDALGNTLNGRSRFLWGARASVSLDDLLHGTSLGGRLAELSGRSVLVATRDQLSAALAMIELDGVARRLIICPSDLAASHLPSVIARGEVDAIVFDCEPPEQASFDIPLQVACTSAVRQADCIDIEHHPTEWVLLTSGTTGVPKMLVHNLAGLTAPIRSSTLQGEDIVWATFYDIRRYGGLQIFLRAVLGLGSFILSDAGETPGDYLLRLGARGVTHISGTPSHWRRALMSPSAHAIEPSYVRLSGEIADQGILDNLRSFYPRAGVGHAYASTEAGVGFDVNDGLEGFPDSMIGAVGDVEMKVEDGSLRIRSIRTAVRYLGEDGLVLADNDGFVDTGDIVELRGDRYYFLGRRSGVINVGGLKVHPEEVEAVINRHPAVRMSLVRSRKNPITGSLVVADVVLNAELDESATDFKGEILLICRESLAAYKIPATIRFVPALDVAAAGKLVRHHA